MQRDPIESFLSRYVEVIRQRAGLLRQLIKEQIPGVHEELDDKARIIGYGFGPKYSDLVCTIIPSKNGLKLGFFKGSELHDPEGLLKGAGKINKHVEINSKAVLKSRELKRLLRAAYKAYLKRTSSNN